MHCPACNSYRPDLRCWKCGAATIASVAGWEYPEAPDAEPLRRAARDVGYALASHGSGQRDVDLVAVPWVESAVGPDELAQILAAALPGPGRVVEREEKPLGRVAFTLQANGWFKAVDLSVAARGCEAPCKESLQTALDAKDQGVPPMTISLEEALRRACETIAREDGLSAGSLEATSAVLGESVTRYREAMALDEAYSVGVRLEDVLNDVATVPEGWVEHEHAAIFVPPELASHRGAR